MVGYAEFADKGYRRFRELEWSSVLETSKEPHTGVERSLLERDLNIQYGSPIFDMLTGLIWPSKITTTPVLAYENAYREVEYLQGLGWKCSLPSVKEILTLADYSQDQSLIVPTFPLADELDDLYGRACWTRDPSPRDPPPLQREMKWGVSLADGYQVMMDCSTQPLHLFPVTNSHIMDEAPKIWSVNQAVACLYEHLEAELHTPPTDLEIRRETLLRQILGLLEEMARAV